MRNRIIYTSAINGEKLVDLANKYKISPTRVAQIIHSQAKKTAPKLYEELYTMGEPRLKDFRQYADQFLHGDV